MTPLYRKWKNSHSPSQRQRLQIIFWILFKPKAKRSHQHSLFPFILLFPLSQILLSNSLPPWSLHCHSKHFSTALLFPPLKLPLSHQPSKTLLQVMLFSFRKNNVMNSAAQSNLFLPFFPVLKQAILDFFFGGGGAQYSTSAKAYELPAPKGKKWSSYFWMYSYFPMKIDTSVWEVNKIWITYVRENSYMKLLHKMIDFIATEVLFKDNIKVILIYAKHFSSTQKRLLISSILKKNSIVFFSSLMI